MSDKKIRISDELYDQLQKIAEKNNKSMKDVVEEAVKSYLLGIEGVDKPLLKIQSKIIATQFDSRCYYCKREVKKGELCYYLRYVYADNTSRSFVVCLDCYYKDTALAEWYLKKKRMEVIVKGLQKKADELVKEIEALIVQKDLQKLKKECVELWEEFKRFILGDESMKKIEELLTRLDSVEEKLKELEDAMLSLSERRKKKIEVRARQ